MARARLAMLPAAHGDCLWFEQGDGDRRMRMLVDAGPKQAYGAVTERLAELAGDDPVVDVFVVTHVDTDHIEGALMLVAADPAPLRFGDVWFNGLAHLEADRVRTGRGGVQGQFLAALLARRSWNVAWGERSVRLWDDGSPVVLASADVAGGRGAEETITLLSPTRAKARSMAKAWRDTCAGAGLSIDDVAEALARFESDGRYETTRGEGGPDAVRRLGIDGSVPNGSSIAFLFEGDGRSILFTGDAHAGVLRESIRRLLTERGEQRLRLDAFKLSHHGSRNNISRELLELVECNTFLVSTSGAVFHHPDPETIELLAGMSGGQRPRVVFNYRSDTTERWASDPRIDAVYGEDGFVVLDL